MWSSNWLAVRVFLEMDTQWRFGPMGATGLDYNVLYRKLDRMKLSDAERDELEHDIGVLEAEALNIMRGD